MGTHQGVSKLGQGLASVGQGVPVELRVPGRDSRKVHRTQEVSVALQREVFCSGLVLK